MLDDIEIVLHEDNFFENDKFIGKELLEQYIDFCRNNTLYSTWKALVNKDISFEVYKLIEPEIAGDISKLKEQLCEIQKNVFYVDLDCFSEGDLVRISDFAGNRYSLTVKGWFCPDRGCIDEIYVELKCNDEVIEYGGIDVSYGDYEMTNDGIPLPSTEDDVFVNISEVNNELSLLVDRLFSELADIESEISKIEI